MQMEVLKSSSDKEMIRWCVHQLTVRALIASVAGRNTHLISIVARVEDWNRDATTSLGLDFDQLFQMLQRFMSVKDDEVFDDEVKSLLKDNYSRIWPQTAEWIDGILAPQSEAWVAFYIGQALEKASNLKEHVSRSLLQYLTLQTRLLFSLEDDREAMVCWFAGGNYDAGISNLILMLLKNGRLAEAEACAAQVLVLTEQIGSLYFKARALLLHVMQSLLAEAEQVGSAHPQLLHNILRDQALNILLQLDFGSFNVGRLCYLESTKYSLRLLQDVLIAQHRRVREDKPITQMHEALIWAERGRSRDLLYNIRMPEQRKAYLEELAEFDRNKDGAWQEIEEIVRLSDPRTAFLILTAVNSKICGYILAYDPNEPEREVNWTCFTAVVVSLADLTMQTLSGRVADSTTCHCSSGGELVFTCMQDMFILPFAAFHQGDGKPFLIEKYAISVVPSLRTYKQCQLQLKKLQQQRNEAGLVIGNPAAGGHFLQRDEATKEAAMELLPKSSWFHIACHAVSNPDFPSGALMLARKASSQPVDAAEDGEVTVVARFERHLEELVRSTGRAEMLTGEDLENAGQPLQAKVAVLSACSTGLGRIFSDGVIGLSRSLHMLGVSSVVASLWNVADDSTNVLMERFYNHLHVDGMNVAKALQRAMISMIKEEDEDTEESKYSPYHWAPFIISGTDTVTLKNLLCFMLAK